MANTMSAVMYGINQGYQVHFQILQSLRYMSFGVVKALGNQYPMTDSDIVMGTPVPAIGYPAVDDFFTMAYPSRGTGRDQIYGGKDDVNGNFTVDAATGISTFIFTRKITTSIHFEISLTDSTAEGYDASLKLGTNWQYLWSMSNQPDTGQYHDNGKNSFFLDLAAVRKFLYLTYC
jgi:hypothetical protein